MTVFSPNTNPIEEFVECEAPRPRVEASSATLITRRLATSARDYAPPLLVAVLVLVIWQVGVQVLQIGPLLLPAPSAIAGAFATNFERLVNYGWYTFQEALIGFAIGCGSGIVVAILCLRWRSLANALLPFSIGFNAVPIIALAPLALVWFGLEQGSKIAIVSIMCFFPTLISTLKGMTSVDPRSLELMYSYAASEWQIFRDVRLPNALPMMFGAFKVCATLSMIGAVVSEFFGGPLKALGVYINSMAGISNFRSAWAAIIVACVLGIAFYLVISLIERLVMPWNVQFRQR